MPFLKKLFQDFTAVSGSKGSVTCEREAASAAAAGNCHEDGPVVALNFHFTETDRISCQHPAVLCKGRCGEGVLWDYFIFPFFFF